MSYNYSEYQLKPVDRPAEVVKGLLYRTDCETPYYQISLPYLGDLWSLDRQCLINWLKDAIHKLETEDYDNKD